MALGPVARSGSHYTSRMNESRSGPPVPLMPATGTLAAGIGGAVWLSADGEIATLSLAEAAQRARREPPLVCHAPTIARRLGGVEFAAYDVLELFAFAKPAEFCAPTPAGLAEALGLKRPHDRTAEAVMVRAAAAALLALLAATPDEGARAIAATMSNAGWGWGPPVLDALGERTAGATKAPSGGLDVWNRLAGWTEQAPPPPPGDSPVGAAEALGRLERLLGEGAESRPGQRDYTDAISAAFAPRDTAGAPRTVLAEAGTGIGKTAGYIAPASLWAEKNGGAVWLSTFTKNLQRQIDQELDRLYPAPADKAAKVVIRKGRENYLCLLNLEEAARQGAAGTRAIALGLMARWAGATRNGDLLGGDFPAWLAELTGYGSTLGLAHRRGECIYSACPHYAKCYIEATIHKARHADIVIANHALVMTQAVAGEVGGALPTRYVLDEGHHLFDAADGAFSAHLSGAEMADLRRWIRGGEGRRKGRVRGLERRVSDLVSDDDEATKALSQALRAAAALPAEGWLRRAGEGQPHGPAERFLAHVWDQVMARCPNPDSDYGLEVTTAEPVPGLSEAASELDRELAALAKSLAALRGFLAARLDEDAAKLETALRIRIEAAIRSLTFRIEGLIQTWRQMLGDVGTERQDDPDWPFVDWFSIDRLAGRDVGIGLHRHWIDPTRPFAEHVLGQAHGVVITSATLRDQAMGREPKRGANDEPGPEPAIDDWTLAEVRTGAHHLTLPARRASLASPFDYRTQARIFIVRDVRRDDPAQVAAAYRELFTAAAGGGLGLFTAIRRLREVYGRIAAALDEIGIALLAQHVDPMDTATLVDIFRIETDSCLLGTDAVRDGVDVPGRALRLIVFDRVPWPRPDILHRARRVRFGGTAYDDMLARLRLKQAYGRLIRRADDRGVFVLLDPMTPSRLTSAFPPGVPIERVGLAEAAAEAARFVGAKTPAR